MKRYDWSTSSADDRRRMLARPPRRVAPEVATLVRQVFEEIGEGGEAALRRWCVKLDGAEPRALELSASAVGEARAALSRAQIQAIELVVDQVRFFHEATKPKSIAVEMAPGVNVRRVWRPIATCGLYAPSGTAPLVSTLIMLAEPARVAGVASRVVVTPPQRDGVLAPAMIVAAAACRVEQIWTIGGAQAIAALALGVLTPKVNKILGPGNAYVAEAKRYAAALSDGPAIDLPAGPSELLVIADRAANARFVAADLLSQAEHDEDAQVLLVSSSAELVAHVQAELQRQIRDLPREAIARRSLENARAILVRSLGEAIDVANAYAPEHLSLQCADPAAVVALVSNAGAVFVGGSSAEAFADYAVGPSHVLPTDGAARTYGGVTTASFMKSFTIQDISTHGASKLAPAVAAIARLEGLEAHARAAELRLVGAGERATPPAAVITRRLGEVVRRTNETQISARVNLDQPQPVEISTGVGFFDHMLEQVALHGGFSLTLTCTGDLEVDAHHTVEDCALAFGQALSMALRQRRGLARFGFVLPMDESEAKISIDLGGRPFLVFHGAFTALNLGAYPTEMTEHVFRSLSQTLGAAIHVTVSGDNNHHKTEACFKALGRALRQAVRVESEDIPSTKGVVQ